MQMFPVVSHCAEGQENFCHPRFQTKLSCLIRDVAYMYLQSLLVQYIWNLLQETLQFADPGSCYVSCGVD